MSHALSTLAYSLEAFYQLYLVTESKRQLLMYLLDKRVSFSMLLLTSASQNGSSEPLTYFGIIQGRIQDLRKGGGSKHYARANFLDTPTNGLTTPLIAAIARLLAAF